MQGLGSFHGSPMVGLAAILKKLFEEIVCWDSFKLMDMDPSTFPIV